MYIVIGHEHFLIESRSRPGEWHCCEERGGVWECSCLGFIRWQRCWHTRFCEAIASAASNQRLGVIRDLSEAEDGTRVTITGECLCP